MTGILGWGGYVPHRRLDRTTIGSVAGSGGRAGTRSVASYDEDTTTMAVEALRNALRPHSGSIDSVSFTTAAPAYLDRTNANTIHAATRLGRDVAAYDALGSARSALGALRVGLRGSGVTAVVSSDIRIGPAGGPEEAMGGDGAAALLVGRSDTVPVLAEVVAWQSLTQEFLDRWRIPGEVSSRLWEERFGETVYAGLGAELIKLACGAAELDVTDVDHLVVSGLSERAADSVAAKSGVAQDRIVDRLVGTIGNVGAAQAALLLCATLERAEPDQTILLVSLADGGDAVVLRTTGALAEYRQTRTVAAQAATGAPVSYGRYLGWRGLLALEPPRRPEPARVSSPASYRNADWKFGFVAGGERAAPHLPPIPTDQTHTAMADARGTVVTFTVDRLSYSPSPPVIFAVVDFEGGGRFPVEITDVDEGDVSIGTRVELTFRRLASTEGIHNYFWKVWPMPGEGAH